MKLLITGGPGEDDTGKRLNHYPTFDLQARPEDREHFIDPKVEDLPDYVFNDHLRTTLSHGLLERTGRTFLRVSIVVTLIADLKAPSPRTIQSVLTENPKALDQLYEKLVFRLIATDTFTKVLIWIPHSKRPLSVEETEDAINYDLNIKPYKSLSEMSEYRGCIRSEFIRRELGTLLETQRKEGLNGRQPQDFVYFIHQLMRDLFHKHHRGIFNECDFIGDCGPDFYLARTCIWYLNAVEFHQISSKGNSDFEHALREVERDNIGLSRNGNLYPGYQKISIRYFFFDYTSMV